MKTVICRDTSGSTNDLVRGDTYTVTAEFGDRVSLAERPGESYFAFRFAEPAPEVTSSKCPTCGKPA